MNIPLSAETIGAIGSFPVTNALVNAITISSSLCLAAFVFRKTVREIPGRFQTAVEALVELLLETFDQVTGSREKTRSFFPFVMTLFLFILFSNWFGLFPGTGSVGIWQLHNGELELIPILRSAGSDLNFTVALAVLSVVTSHAVGMFSVGFFTHWGRFIQIAPLIRAIRTFDVMKIFIAIIEIGVGLIELVSEAAKVLSLSLRLFGNIFAGEVLITVISSILAFALPLPFMGLEIIVGIVQATVFSMLTLVYLSMHSELPHHDEDSSGEKSGAGETMRPAHIPAHG